MILPLGKDLPLLSLGLGEMDDKSREEIMAPHTKQQQDSPSDLNSGIRREYISTGIAEQRQLTTDQDTENEISRYLGVSARELGTHIEETADHFDDRWGRFICRYGLNETEFKKGSF